MAMSGEAALTDEQRERWSLAVDAAKGRIDPRYPDLDPWDRMTVAVSDRLAWLEAERTALIEENRRMREALVGTLLPLEALNSAVTWELAPSVKTEIAAAVTQGRAALSPSSHAAAGEASGEEK